MSVLLVAAPLSARSGVYRSTIDLVRAARAAGEDWSAVIGVRPGAGGTPTPEAGVTEFDIAARGSALLSELRQRLAAELDRVDTVITMVPQSDVAVAGSRSAARHVAWVRGLPWPGPGEQRWTRSAFLRYLETRALRRADAVWATSPLLAEQIRRARRAELVPAGIPLLHRTTDGRDVGPLVWAGRISPEKGAREFLDVVRSTEAPAVLFGEGPLRDALVPDAPDSLTWKGWARPEDVWARPGILLCTSHRDAFGRSPVEAASAGMPVILSDQTGAAPFLYTEQELADRFILPVGDTAAWSRAVRSLIEDEQLRVRVSDHVYANAQRLSIEASFAAARSHLK